MPSRGPNPEQDAGDQSVDQTGDGPPHKAPNRRARLDADTRRAQIIAAACDLLESDGVTAMTIEEVAEAAGVSRSLVYSYFGDRDSLVAEVYLRVLEQVDDEVQPGLSRGVPDSWEAILERIRSLLRFGQAHPAAWRLLVTDSVRRHPAVSAARAGRVARLTGGAGDGRGPLVADATLGLLEAGVLHWVDEQALPLDVAAELLASTLWSGITKHPPAE